MAKPSRPHPIFDLARTRNRKTTWDGLTQTGNYSSKINYNAARDVDGRFARVYLFIDYDLFEVMHWQLFLMMPVR